jgi:hypothetical protein
VPSPRRSCSMSIRGYATLSAVRSPLSPDCCRLSVVSCRSTAAGSQPKTKRPHPHACEFSRLSPCRSRLSMQPAWAQDFADRLQCFQELSSAAGEGDAHHLPVVRLRLGFGRIPGLERRWTLLHHFRMVNPPSGKNNRENKPSCTTQTTTSKKTGEISHPKTGPHPRP